MGNDGELTIFLEGLGAREGNLTARLVPIMRTGSARGRSDGRTEARSSWATMPWRGNTEAAKWRSDVYAGS